MLAVKFMKKNWKIKLGSVTAALLLFWYVGYTRNITRNINIRVVKPEVPAGLTLNTKIPSFIPVKFTGIYDIIDFNVSEFRIHLENSNPENGENIYQTRLVPDLPEEIKAEYAESISILLDRELQRQIPVQADLKIKLNNGVRQGYTYTSPVAVTVKGPATVVSGINSIKTEAVKVDMSDSSITLKTKLLPLPDFVEYANIKKEEVSIFIRGFSENQIGENEQRIDGLKITCLNHVSDLQMKVLASDDVSIRVLNTDEKKLNPQRFRAKVFCPAYYDGISKSIKPSSVIENVGVVIEDLEGQIDILEVIPSYVTIQFEKREALRLPPRAERKGFKEHVIQ